jgi:hypothetical protein
LRIVIAHVRCEVCCLQCIASRNIRRPRKRAPMSTKSKTLSTNSIAVVVGGG